MKDIYALLKGGDMKKKDPEVIITEKYYLTKGGAITGEKRIEKITVNGKEVPFRQIDKYGRFEFL